MSWAAVRSRSPTPGCRQSGGGRPGARALGVTHLTMPRRSSPRDCARALWLLGIEPPVTPPQLQAAYRARIAQAHPDLHLDSEARTEAANVLSRALNEARDLVSEWIASDRSWPALAGSAHVARNPPAPDPVPAPLCRRTGLRSGDLVRVWPYDGDVEVVA